MGYIRLEKDSDGIVELIFDQPGKTVNTMGVDYDKAMQKAIVDIEAMVAEGSVAGIYVRSGKKDQFFAGGDITEMLAMDLNCSVEKKTDGTLVTNIVRRVERLLFELIQAKYPNHGFLGEESGAVND